MKNNMTKEKKECSGTRATGYWKGYNCGAHATIEIKGKWYCKNHIPLGTYEELHNAYENAMALNNKLINEMVKKNEEVYDYKQDYKIMDKLREENKKLKEKLYFCHQYFEEEIADCDSPGTRQTLKTMMDISKVGEKK